MLVNVADDAGTGGQPIECKAVAPDGLPCDHEEEMNYAHSTRTGSVLGSATPI